MQNHPNTRCVLRLSASIVLVLQCVIGFAQTAFDSEDLKQRLILDKILESEVKEGRFIKGDPEKMGFDDYDMKLLPVKKALDKRMYTMTGTYMINEGLKDTDISLFVGPSEYPFNIYINGELIYRRGSYKDFYNSIIYTSSNIRLSPKILNYGKTTNRITLQAFPDFEVNCPPDLIITSNKNASLMTFWRDFFNVHLVRGVAMIAMVLFFYFMFLFMARISKDKKHLYFALLCFFYFFAYINISFKNDFSNEILLERMSRTAFPVTVLFLTFFIMEFTGILNKRAWIKILISLPTTAVSFFTFFVMHSKKEILNLFNITTNYIITPMMVFGIILIIISIFKDKNKGSIVLLASFAAVISTSLHDIRYLTNFITPYSWMVPFGYIAMALSIFFILAVEQSKLYRESVLRSKELDGKNLSLKKMMDNITIVSESLVASGRILDKTVSDLLISLEDYGKSNKAIMDKVLGEFGKLESMINKITEHIDISSQRIPIAVSNQTSVVEEVTSTITNMNKDLESTAVSSSESNETARSLYEFAEKSSKNMMESKKAIDTLSEYSKYINQLLNTIEDITEKTNVLAINASIESANAGEKGKGFSIISSEIRKLAQKSKISLSSSIEKINEMKEIIQKSTRLSDSVTDNLLKIIEESNNSARKIQNITEMIKDQKYQSDAILQAIQSLLEDSMTIKDLVKQEDADNAGIKETLTGLKGSFLSITELLKTQEQKESAMSGSLGSIRDILNENLKNIDILNESLNIREN